MRAFGLLVRLVSIGWLLFLLEPLSSTGLDFPFFLVAFSVTVFAGIEAFTLVLARGSVSWTGLCAWLAYPVAAGALLVLFLGSQSPANPLFRLRFQLSRPALDEAARAALATTPSARPRWVGLFPVHHVDVDAPEVRFMSDGCGVVDEFGLVYLPGPKPPRRPKTNLKHLGGPWYHLYAVF
jgi:hypothetical protein